MGMGDINAITPIISRMIQSIEINIRTIGSSLLDF